MTLHPSFCSPPDLVRLDTWKNILGRYFAKVRFPGIDPKRYPFDLGSYVMMYPEMVNIAQREKIHGEPFKKPAYDDLVRFLVPKS
jgi:hypothetical protein